MHWPAEAIWEAVEPLLPGFTVEIVPQIDSTNTELMRRAKSGHVQPILLVAEQQTAGRGRMGREWVDGALSFSLGLPLTATDWSGLSLAVGLAVVGSLHPALQLKWPNDVLFQGRKLAGILIETMTVSGVRFAVIGVGVNIHLPHDGALRTPPASLQELLPTLDRGQVLHRLVEPLVRTLQHFEQAGFAPLVTAYQERDALMGREVLTTDGLSGVAMGVDSTGALLVHTAQGLRKINSAEVSVRAVPT
jgi:BirA family transcriptional regulator, biotin operon repressor / biotin---[acetyl-CoA-carboxylase] ligase